MEWNENFKYWQIEKLSNLNLVCNRSYSNVSWKTLTKKKKKGKQNLHRTLESLDFFLFFILFEYLD